MTNCYNAVYCKGQIEQACGLREICRLAPCSYNSRPSHHISSPCQTLTPSNHLKHNARVQIKLSLKYISDLSSGGIWLKPDGNEIEYCFVKSLPSHFKGRQ